MQLSLVSCTVIFGVLNAYIGYYAVVVSILAIHIHQIALVPVVMLSQRFVV